MTHVYQFSAQKKGGKESKGGSGKWGYQLSNNSLIFDGMELDKLIASENENYYQSVNSVINSFKFI